MQNGHDVGNPNQKRKKLNEWYISHHSLENPLTNIEVTSIRDILNPKYLPIVELSYWAI